MKGGIYSPVMTPSFRNIVVEPTWLRLSIFLAPRRPVFLPRGSWEINSFPMMASQPASQIPKPTNDRSPFRQIPHRKFVDGSGTTGGTRNDSRRTRGERSVFTHDAENAAVGSQQTELCKGAWRGWMDTKICKLTIAIHMYYSIKYLWF